MLNISVICLAQKNLSVLLQNLIFVKKMIYDRWNWTLVKPTIQNYVSGMVHWIVVQLDGIKVCLKGDSLNHSPIGGYKFTSRIVVLSFAKQVEFDKISFSIGFFLYIHFYRHYFNNHGKNYRDWLR